MTVLKTNILNIDQRIKDICATTGGLKTPLVLAVSKTRPVSQIRQANKLGIRDFGENYLQEAIEKQKELTDLSINWHFIGNIQSNKCREIAESFSWVHSIDRFKVAEKLSHHRPEELAPLNVCIQVNVDNDPAKGGISLNAVPELARLINNLPGIRLRGLMTIPQKATGAETRQSFSILAATLKQLQVTIPALDTLSMGMSDDFDLAIESGATIVRLGTCLFGPRPEKI